MRIPHFVTLSLATLILAGTAYARQNGRRELETPEVRQMQSNDLLVKVIGKWKGKCRTWFEPGKLADESDIAGEFVQVFGGRFVRHTYVGAIQGKPRHGEEMLAFNSIEKSFQSSWVDDFHMNFAIMFSQGKQVGNGFSVRGEYDVGENQPQWGWRTEYKFIDDNHLTITSYNIHPEGMEAKAVEVAYERVR